MIKNDAITSPYRMISSRDVSGWLYLLIAASVLVTFLLTSRVLDNLATPSVLQSPKIYSPLRRVQDSRNIHHISPAPSILTQTYSSTERLDTVISRERRRMAEDLTGFEAINGEAVASYQMEDGGQPVRAMVATTWRSGSTFLGDIMTAHPGTFYHYEPLLHYDIVQARSGALAEDAIRTLGALMRCNYTSLERYLQYGKQHQWLFSHNERLWAHCLADGPQFRKSYCWEPAFLNRFCPLFPFQSIKTVRLRLNLTKTLVEDFNVRILLLVRDPRGTTESRKHRDWCPGNPDCEDPARLCQDLESDYHAFQTLSKQYPGKYKMFRYEDFSMDPYNNTKEIFNFFGMTFHKRVEEFLDTHTKTNIGGVSSTFRDSKTAPFKWREKLKKKEVLEIQAKCEVAMKLWGYKTLTEDQDLQTFQPVRDLEKFKL